MGQEFITIAEAVILTGESDVTLMRLLKEALEASGIPLEQITRKEQREKGMMYLLNKDFLLKALAGEPTEVKASKEAELQAEEIAEERSSASIETPREVLKVKDEMIAVLQGVLETKDRQMDDLSKKIDELIERDRETNFLLRGLQEKIFALEGPKRDVSSEKKSEATKAEKTKSPRPPA